ncbi:amidohydrolase [Desulfogranum japonicum]|uniref:amidohydrolase n=1 Tax=Desulfogranum japonicum TaxID=231447 RepID=UPI0004072200|nr:amidohydrolase [Desulfogranum japonicum]
MNSDISITNCLPVEDMALSAVPSLSYITITGDTITDIGPMEAYHAGRDRTTLDAHGQLALPGLVNAHSHAAMTLFRGLADDLDLSTWLHTYIFPAEAQWVSEEMVYWCSKLAAAEMVLGGITTVADGYFFEHAAAKAFAEVGMRSVAAQALVDFPVPGVPDPTKGLTTCAEFISTWKDKNPLITPALFAHSPYTCSPKNLVKAKQLANDAGVPLFIHLAETQYEIEIIPSPLGETPTRHLLETGILDANTVCVHCVWCTPADLDILAENNCSIVICPQSHAKLASGMAPLRAMLDRNIRVGLGTDGSASNNSLDIFREMDFCAKVQKMVCNDAVAVPAREILSCATDGGSTALLPSMHIGRLAPGQKADILLADIHRPHLQPFYTTDTMVYSGDPADVQTVLINGNIVVRDRVLQTCDLAEVMAKVRELAQHVGNQ